MKLINSLLVFCFILIIYCFSSTMCSIYKNLKYFETLHWSKFNHHILHDNRGTKYFNNPFNIVKELHFKTLGKKFRLILHPHNSVLHSNLKAYSVDGKGKKTEVIVDLDTFYTGRVFGDRLSDVKLHIDEGVIMGIIHTSHDSYHIEPSWRHLPGHEDGTMITYRSSDINFSWTNANSKKPRVCGYVKEGEELEEDPFHEFFYYDSPLTIIDQSEWNQYFMKLEGTWYNNIRPKHISDEKFTPTKTRCPLLLVADYRFYQEMGASNAKTTVNYLISLINRVHMIFNETKWLGYTKAVEPVNGIGFIIKKIVVHSEPTLVQRGKVHYNMVREKWNSRNMLEVFSREYSHKYFCLAHLFTDIKFKGISGLAYLGSYRKGSVGGICTADYFKHGHTLYLNSGLISSRNHYGQRIITREADIVTAHQFGHSWGSDHDSKNQYCSPNEGESYLMSSHYGAEYNVNSKIISPCSSRAIRKALIARSHRCFIEPEQGICGNLQVEGNEECDAGLLGMGNQDNCCSKNCKLKKNTGAVCSDKNSPCCSGCLFAPLGILCREATPSVCEDKTFCTGNSAECPRAPPMADDYECADQGRCRNGLCLPFCETLGMDNCMCNVAADACKLCCRRSLNTTCLPVDINYILPDGTPCIRGFCNKGICEQELVESIWTAIDDINIPNVLTFMRENMMNFIILIVTIIWLYTSFAFVIN